MRAASLAAAAAAGLLLASDSPAGWATAAGGNGSGQAAALENGPTPTASVPLLSMTITVTWGASPLATGYAVTRYNGLGVAQAPTGTCAGTVTATSCTETVATGVYTYRIALRRNAWMGGTGSASTPVSTPGL